MLYIFYKPSKISASFSNNIEARAYNDSVAENLLYEWQS
jgi:hypothetical protein